MRLLIKLLNRFSLERQKLSEKIRGLDFISIVQPESVGLDSKLAYRSSPSGDEYLNRLLKDCRIQPNDAIIDVGCGKGNALRWMSRFPFATIDGLELSDQLASIARRNFNRLGEKRVTIYTGDARAFEGYDAYDFIYFYNPFPEVVMQDVMQALIQSVERHPRELILIYNNPTCETAVLQSGRFQVMATYPAKWNNRIVLYSNKTPAQSRLRHLLTNPS